MSSSRATARKQMLSVLTVRAAGPFNDATNHNITRADSPAQKPVSRRLARQRTKRIRKNATQKKKHEVASADAITEAVVQAPPPVTPCPPRAIPILIIRTLPGLPVKKFYGPFEACSREDVLVEETRTWEEDAWGVIYGPHDIAATVAGPVRVITLQAEAGFPGGAQIFYG
ncbi:hypothetical protein B0H19DRAFT_1259122 [Mycena capillaripes]|nr:hypothetical protein B0H19DRAFT_1259122 [Mycena capillaripes]